MKNLIISLLFILFLTSCNHYVVKNIYNQTYTSEELAVTDVFYQLESHFLDSIPLDQWIPNVMTVDTIIIDQKTIRKILDRKTEYSYIYTKYIYPSSTSYNFVIHYKGKEK